MADIQPQVSFDKYLDPNNVDAQNQYQQILAGYKQDPVSSFKHIQILKETQNPIVNASKGKEFLSKIQDDLGVNPVDIENSFKPYELNDEQKKAVISNPDIIKNTYNRYTYGDDPISTKMKIRDAYSAMRLAYIDKGQDPDQFLRKDNAVMKGLEFVGNLISVPSNVLAKTFNQITTGDSSKVPVWGGTGWEEAFRQLGADDEMQGLIAKVHNNVPLTPDEDKKVKDFDKTYGILGTIGNIVLDPLVLADLGGSALAKTGVKGAEKIASGLKYFAHPIASFNQAHRYMEMEKTGQLLNDGKSLLSNMKQLMTADAGLIGDETTAITKSLSPEAKSVIKGHVDTIDKVLMSPDASINQVQNVIRKSQNIMEKYSLTKELKIGKLNKPVPISDLANKYTKNIITSKEYNTPEQHKIFHAIDDKVNTAKTVLHNFAEKTGIRKALLSNYPIYKETKILDEATGKVKKTMTPTGYKDVFDKVRRTHDGMIKQYTEYGNKINKIVKKDILPILKAEPKVVEHLKNYPEHSIGDIVTQIVERPAKAEKDFGIKPEIVKAIHDANNEIALKEVQEHGSKFIPLLKNDADRKEWKKLADEYSTMYHNNQFHPEYANKERDIKEFLKNSNGVNIVDNTVADGLADDMSYVLHAATKPAQVILHDLKAEGRGFFGEGLRSFITRSGVSNQSWKQRGIEGSAMEINDAIRDGKLANHFRDQAEIFRKQASDFKESLKGKKLSKEEKKKFTFADEYLKKANAYDGIANVADRLRKEGVNLFDSDINKLWALRAKRSARGIQQSVFHDEVMKFGKDSPEGDTLVKPILNGKPIPGFSDKYFEPEVAKAIEKMYNITSTDKGIAKFTNFLQDVQNLWKAQTLSLYPITDIRNVVGLAFNSLLFDTPVRLVQSIKDAINAIHLLSFPESMLNKKLIGEASKANYKILTPTHTVKLKEVLDQAMKRNIMSNVQDEINVLKEPAVGVLGKVGEGLKTISGAMKKMPTAIAHNAIENNMRLALFISMVKDGKTYDEAEKIVSKALFDYGDLTDVEMKLRKTVVPFYTWVRKNIPLQLGQLLSNPSKAQMKIYYALQQDRPSDERLDERYQTEFLSHAATVKTPGNKYYILENNIPMFDIARVLKMSEGIQPAVDEVFRDVSPFIKEPIQQAANYNFQTHKPIQKADLETQEFLGLNMAPRVKELLSNLRIATVLNKGVNIPTDRTLTGPDKDILTMVMSFGLINPVKYNVAYSKQTTSRDYNDKISSEINNFKTFMFRYKTEIVKGKKPTKADAKYLIDRTGKIVNMINQGFNNGLVDHKGRGKYFTEIVNTWKK